MKQLSVTQTLIEGDKCFRCRYAKHVSPADIKCTITDKYVSDKRNAPIPDWCPVVAILGGIKQISKRPTLTDLEWQDYVVDHRLLSANMQMGKFSMVVQGPDQRQGAPYKEGRWMLSSDLLGLTRYCLAAITGTAAKEEAVEIARHGLRVVLNQIRDVIVEIERNFIDVPDTTGLYDGVLTVVW